MNRFATIVGSLAALLCAATICACSNTTHSHAVVRSTAGRTEFQHAPTVSGRARSDAISSPPSDAVYTSTREVTSLVVESDGTLWVGTMGGVLRYGKEGAHRVWRKFTQRDGLPSHETRRIVIERGVVTVVFPRASTVWRANRWYSRKTDGRSTRITGLQEDRICAAVWRGALYEATLTGLHVCDGRAWRDVSLPVSRGTHISAMLPHGTALWAALFCDGLWAFTGKAWQLVNIGLPTEAREITAMAVHGPILWLGTRRAGVWQYDGRSWKQYLQPDEPFNHNAQALAMFQGRMFVSTLEDGLAMRTASGWHLETVPIISSVAPRQMAEFKSALYLRHGSGRVDRFDGRTWSRDVCAGLPRKQATMIASDRKRLYVAQWGGWSEYDGNAWTHCLKLPDLQGRTLTSLYPDGDTLWIGTQNRGIASFDHRTGRLSWHDERQGLPDDWITSITRVGRILYVGTYVGGLARWDGARLLVGELTGANVTDLSPDGAGGVWVATRTGLWHRDPSGLLTRPDARAYRLPTEIQTLCSVQDGLWVGARTGLFFLAKQRSTAKKTVLATNQSGGNTHVAVANSRPYRYWEVRSVPPEYRIRRIMKQPFDSIGDEQHANNSYNYHWDFKSPGRFTRRMVRGVSKAPGKREGAHAYEGPA